jgi:PAS domain S-box-containing protein
MKGRLRRGDELSAIIEVYLNIFNDLFSALMRGGLEFATERTMPYVEQVFREFPRVFSGFRLELRELNHYILLKNSREVDEKEMFLGLQMLIRIMYNECRELVKDISAFVSDKTRASVMRNYGALKEHGLLEAIPPEFRGFEKESKKVLLPYGRGYTAITVPRDAEVLTLEKQKALEDFAARLEEALAKPIGCERLEKMVKEGEKVAIIIDDYTRKTPTRKILPVVLEKIEKRTKQITIVVASGLHRVLTEEEIKKKIGKARVRYPVVFHDANSPDLVTIGKMFTGTELRINRAVAEADFVLSLGSIMPHPYAGFSGGAKCILPGVAGRDAIVSSHLLNVYPGCAVNKLKDNPMRQEIENAGKLANLRFIVNTILGPQGEVLDLVCGDPREAFQQGAELCERLYSVEYSEKADVVIATPGGYPKDSTLYLSLRGLRTAELMLKEKGTIILVAKCEEQVNEKFRGKSFRELLEGDPRDLISFSLLQKYNLVLVSEIRSEGGVIEGVEVYRDANAALRRVISRLGLDAKIIVAPDIYMIPKMRISEKVQLESIMNTMEAGISIVGEDMRIRYMNPYLLNLFGAEAIGRNCYEVFAGEEKPCPRCSVGGKIGLHKTETIEVSRKGKTFLITHSPMKTPDGRVMVLEILTDITKRKKLEKKLKEYSERLEQKVEERTRELKKANEFKDLFTDIMRHEVLNPLGVIKGIAQFMDRMEEFKGRKEIEVIRRNAEKIERIIESSVKFSKISAMEKLDFQEMDLDKILKEVIKNMRPMAEKKGMKIKYKPLKGSMTKVNPIIKDVFTNLLSNAIKYSPPKTLINVDLEDIGDKWRVVVKDQGVGIPDEYKKTVFERFIRADKRGVKGTGLGLAIVKRIVDLHKGEVWVEDNVVEHTDEKGRRKTKKQGSVFYVTIPKNLG